MAFVIAESDSDGDAAEPTVLVAPRPVAPPARGRKRRLDDDVQGPLVFSAVLVDTRARPRLFNRRGRSAFLDELVAFSREESELDSISACFRRWGELPESLYMVGFALRIFCPRAL